MTVRRIAFLVLTLFLVCGIAAADPGADKSLTVRTFQFKFKDADKAAAVIKTQMSAEGSISIQPATNSLVITDKPENMKVIAATLAQYDAPARQFKLSVRLVAASRVEGGGPRTPDDLRDVAQKLSMLRYNSFEDLGEANVEGKEGEPGLVEMKTGYRADFKFGEFDPSSDTIKVSDFRLSKLQGAQHDELATLLKTSLNLKIGQTVILGASKGSQSQRALMIVVMAKR